MEIKTENRLFFGTDFRNFWHLSTRWKTSTPHESSYTKVSLRVIERFSLGFWGPIFPFETKETNIRVHHRLNVTSWDRSIHSIFSLEDTRVLLWMIFDDVDPSNLGWSSNLKDKIIRKIKDCRYLHRCVNLYTMLTINSFGCPKCKFFTT